MKFGIDVPDSHPPVFKKKWHDYNKLYNNNNIGVFHHHHYYHYLLFSLLSFIVL